MGSSRRRWSLFACFFSVLLAVHGTARAEECFPSWNHTIGQQGLTRTSAGIRALALFGSGENPNVIAGGKFQIADQPESLGVASWDGTTWSALGQTAGEVRALAVFDDGSGPALFAAGAFSEINGVQVGNIARWDGKAWTSLAEGVNDVVLTLAVFDDGTGPALYAAGKFNIAGGKPAGMIARWKNNSWSDLAEGFSTETKNQFSATIRTMCVYAFEGKANLVVAGTFDTVEGAKAGSVARWDGSAWLPVGTGFEGTRYTSVNALVVHDDGAGPSLYAAGHLGSSFSNGPNAVARWNGSEWSPVGGAMSDTPQALASLPAASAAGVATLCVLGSFEMVEEKPVSGIARWDGSQWQSGTSSNESGHRQIYNAAIVRGEGSQASLVIGGKFSKVAGQNASGVVELLACGGTKPTPPAPAQTPSPLSNADIPEALRGKLVAEPVDRQQHALELYREVLATPSLLKYVDPVQAAMEMLSKNEPGKKSSAGSLMMKADFSKTVAKEKMMAWAKVKVEGNQSTLPGSVLTPEQLATTSTCVGEKAYAYVTASKKNFDTFTSSRGQVQLIPKFISECK